MKLPVARFAPDRSPYAAEASPELLNVVPTLDGVEPMPGPQPFTPAVEYLVDEITGETLTSESGDLLVVGPGGIDLTGEVQLSDAIKGVFYGRLPNGTDIRIVATASKIYRVDTTEKTFIDISRTSGGAYNVPLNGFWSFKQFGSVIYGQNGVDTEQKFTIGVDTVFSDNSTAPVAKYLMVANDRLHRLCLAADSSQQQWCGLNNPANNVLRNRGCDIQPHPIGNGITGGIDMSFGALVFFRSAIRRQIYSREAQWVYQFDTLTSDRGAVSPGSICKIGVDGADDFVFYAADGFFRGLGMQPIGGEKLNKWFLANTDESARINMTSALDRKRNAVLFRFATVTGANWVLGYQWQLNEWFITDAPMQALFTVETAAITIDGLDDIFETIDDITPPFDSSYWDGGATELGGVTDDGYYALMNGPNMAARIVSNQLADQGHQRYFVNSGRLDSDATNASVTMATADVKGGVFRNRNAVSPSTRTGMIPLRGDGRVFRITTEIPEGEEWTFFGGIWLAEQNSGRQ